MTTKTKTQKPKTKKGNGQLQKTANKKTERPQIEHQQVGQKGAHS